MKRLLLIFVFLAACVSVRPANQATVLNVFHFDVDDPMMLTIEQCVTGAAWIRPAPSIFVVKELFGVSYTEEGIGGIVGGYNPYENVIYITEPLTTSVLEHELVHWANPRLPHNSDLFYKCSHLY